MMRNFKKVCGGRAGLMQGLAAMVLVAVAAPPAGADGVAAGIRVGLADTARQIAQFLAGHGQQSIAVGQFTGPTALPSSSANITKILIDELGKLRVAVQRAATFEIKGDYLAARNDETGKTVLRVKARLLRAMDGQDVLSFVKDIDNDVELAGTIGVTGNLPGSKDPEGGPGGNEPPPGVGELIQQPAHVFINGSRISASAESPYAIETLVKSGEGYQPRPVAQEDGLAFVSLRKNDVFAVRLINNSPQNMAVNLTLDGLGMFAFTDSGEFNEETPIIINKKSSYPVLGWHRTNLVADEFLITAYGKSGAAQLLPKSTSVGTITATFRVANQVFAYVEEDVAVGRGNKVKTNLTTGRYVYGPVAAVVSVRYRK